MGPKERLFFIDKAFNFLGIFFKYGFTAWAAVKVVEALAGQETIVNVAIQYFAKGGNFFPWATAVVAGAWGYGERRLRHRKVAAMSDHIEQLEKRLDPSRTSSGLTREGRTPSNSRLREVKK